MRLTSISLVALVSVVMLSVACVVPVGFGVSSYSETLAYTAFNANSATTHAMNQSLSPWVLDVSTSGFVENTTTAEAFVTIYVQCNGSTRAGFQQIHNASGLFYRASIVANGTARYYSTNVTAWGNTTAQIFGFSDTIEVSFNGTTVLSKVCNATVANQLYHNGFAAFGWTAGSIEVTLSAYNTSYMLGQFIGTIVTVAIFGAVIVMFRKAIRRR